MPSACSSTTRSCATRDSRCWPPRNKCCATGSRCSVSRRPNGCEMVMEPRQRQKGNTVIGFVAGLVAGLLIAVGVALYMTKAPVPFMNKVQRPSENAKAPVATDGKLPDPNSALYSKPVEPPKIDPAKVNAKTDPRAAP